jgi:hypothetical protein
VAAGALDRQGREYARLLAAADPADPWTSGLIDEIDNKFLLLDGAGAALDGPWLLAVHDLMRMRGTLAPADGEDTSYERYGLPLLSAGELAAQEPAFVGEPQLYAFLKANRAFYVDKDYRAVLQLLPTTRGSPRTARSRSAARSCAGWHSPPSATATRRGSGRSCSAEQRGCTSGRRSSSGWR